MSDMRRLLWLAVMVVGCAVPPQGTEEDPMPIEAYREVLEEPKWLGWCWDGDEDLAGAFPGAIGHVASHALSKPHQTRCLWFGEWNGVKVRLCQFERDAVTTVAP